MDAVCRKNDGELYPSHSNLVAELRGSHSCIFAFVESIKLFFFQTRRYITADNPLFLLRKSFIKQIRYRYPLFFPNFQGKLVPPPPPIKALFWLRGARSARSDARCEVCEIWCEVQGLLRGARSAGRCAAREVFWRTLKKRIKIFSVRYDNF